MFSAPPGTSSTTGSFAGTATPPRAFGIQGWLLGAYSLQLATAGSSGGITDLPYATTPAAVTVPVA
jgi:hypothetical protein